VLKELQDDDVSELCNKAALRIKIVKIVKIDQPNLSDTSLYISYSNISDAQVTQ
jgi:hypothetical protein